MRRFAAVAPADPEPGTGCRARWSLDRPTGGEQRISNVLLWQLAYTELYFTETLWPDFDAAALDRAISSYQNRERRFGRTSEQLDSAGRVARISAG